MKFSGKRFRQAREAAGMTRANAAHDLGVVASTLQEYERGREPKVGTAVAAAGLFGVPLEQFFIHDPESTTDSTGCGPTRDTAQPASTTVSPIQTGV